MRLLDEAKKLAVRLTGADYNDIKCKCLSEVFNFTVKNLNVDESGNLIVKEYVEPVEPSQPSLTPFSVGDTIEKGTTYAFDKSKGSDIESMLNGLTYEIADGIGIVDLLGTFTLDNGDREPTLVALSINGANGLFVIDSDTYVPIYATGAINYYVIKATQGWNIDGDTYTLLQTARPSRIQSILETTPAWNGVLVGKAESGASAPSLTAFKNGDIYKTGTRLIFPKSQMDNLEAFFRDRLANWTFGEDFDMLHQKGSSGGLFSIMNADGTGIFLVTSSGMDGAIWLSADMDTGGQIMQAGWHTENMVDDGDNYVFTVGEGVEAEVETETDFAGKAYLDQWNGIMIGIDNSQVQG